MTTNRIIHLKFNRSHVIALLLLICLSNVSDTTAPVDNDSCASVDSCSTLSDNSKPIQTSRMSQLRQASASGQPYIRNAMARAMYNKMMQDKRDMEADHRQVSTVLSYLPV